MIGAPIGSPIGGVINRAVAPNPNPYPPGTVTVPPSFGRFITDGISKHTDITTTMPLNRQITE